MPGGPISVFLADDNAIVREGVRAILALAPDLEVVGVACEYDELIAEAERLAPQVLVTDIRMPPTFQREGIDAAKEVRKRHPGTGVVVLSQYDDPEYAVSLLSEGAAGYAYLLKGGVAEGEQLAAAVRQVASGGSMLDPKIVDALVRPVTDDGELTAVEEELLHMVAAGRPIKAIAVTRGTAPAAVADDVEQLFLKISRAASVGASGSLRRLRLLHQAIVDREEQGETLSRLLPGGLAEKLRRDGAKIGDVEELDVTVLMSDVRGYSAIAEKSDPSRLAGQVNTHR
jgi:adenylate cyclase